MSESVSQSVSQSDMLGGDRLWRRIGLSEEIRFQLFSKSRDTIHGFNCLMELVPFCGSSY